MTQLNHAVCFAAIVSAAVPLAASAATISLTEDYLISSTGFNSNDQNNGTAFRVGANSSALRNGVFVFQLPNLGAISDPFTAASLTSKLAGKDTTPAFTYNADVYGYTATTENAEIDPAPSGMVAFEGASDSSSSFTKLIEDYYTPSTLNNVAITATGDLLSFLNARYAGGAGVGDYVYLRVSPDASATLSTGYFIRGQEQEDSSSASYNLDTFITYTAVPEPASVALLGLGSLLLGRRRKTV